MTQHRSWFTTFPVQIMALQLDANALGALTKLLDKVTDKHESHQDTAALQQIKSFCKQSDENITWFSSVLLHRLKEDHAQVLVVPGISTGSISPRCARDSSLWQYPTCPNLCVKCQIAVPVLSLLLCTHHASVHSGI